MTLGAAALSAWSTVSGPGRAAAELGVGELLVDGETTREVVTPDGGHLVYEAANGDGQVELYSLALAGGAPVQLSPPLPDGSEVDFFLLDASGERAVFRADAAVDGAYDLFSVPVAGGGAVQLNAPLSDGAQVVWIVPRPSSDVVFVVDTADGPDELWATPIDGGEPVRLDADRPVGYVLGDIRVTADGSTVVYTGDEPGDTVGDRLFAVSTSGGPSVELAQPLVDGGNISDVDLTPDGVRAVFLGDRDTDGVDELYSVPVGGGSVTRLCADLPVGGDVRLFLVADDRVVYAADGEIDETTELYSVPVTGGESNRLNESMAAGGDVLLLPGLYPRLTPDGARVVYVADALVDEERDAFAVLVSGGPPQLLSGYVEGNDGHDPAGVAPGDDVTRVVAAPATAPGATPVVFLTDASGTSRDDLWSAPVTGGPATRIATGLSTSSTSPSVEITADGRRVLYLPEAYGDLFVVPIAGGTARAVNPPRASGDWVMSITASPDPSTALYTMLQGSPGIERTYRTTFATCAGAYATVDLALGELPTSGADVVAGTDAADTVDAGSGADLVCGGDGDDTIRAGSGADTVLGGDGADTVTGGRRGDDLRGGSGDDVVEGGRGGDVVTGRVGDDVVHGDAGDDDLRGGQGTDACDGGRGTDTASGCETEDDIP